jgi:hypothetical protein
MFEDINSEFMNDFNLSVCAFRQYNLPMLIQLINDLPHIMLYISPK